MASYGVLHRVALVRTDVSEELSAYFIRVTRICELGTTPAVTSNRRTLRRIPLGISPILVTLMNEALSSSEASVLTSATRRNIPEDAIIHNHRRENLKSYKLMGYLGTAVTNQNLILKEIMRRLNSGNACYLSEPNPTHLVCRLKT
jgi:hypothetical protein